MKIHFILTSTFFTPEETEKHVNTPYTIDWNLPVLPIDGDEIDVDDIITDFDNSRSLLFTVSGGTIWRSDQDGVYAEIWLNGE